MTTPMQTQEQIKRKQLIVAISAAAGLFLVVYLGMEWSSRNTPKTEISYKPKTDEIAKNYALPMDAVKPEDKWQATAAGGLADNNKRINEVQQKLNELMAENEALKNGTSVAGSASPSGLPVLPSKVPDAPDARIAFPPLPPPPQLPTQAPVFQPIQQTPVATPPATIEEIDLSDGSGIVKTAKGLLASKDKDSNSTTGKTVESFVPAGTFAKVVFLTGFDAPTGGQAQGNALPVVMRVKSFMTLPNRFKSNLKECFIIGNGYGDMASERAYIRIERLSCVLRDGKVLETKVKGHVAGEDASFGLRGRVVSKQGQLIAKSFFAGLFSGMGKNIAEQSSVQQTSALGVVTTYDPNKTVESGIATGVATSASKIADFWLSQANSIFPIIEISAGRVGEVFLMEGADLGDLKVAADNSLGE
jgi:conjugal transfer pilus assembly protein TraB